MVQTVTARSAKPKPASGHAYARREPEKTALYQVFQRHLPSFEIMWVNSDFGGCLPKHVTQELHQFLTCGILSHGFAQMHCDACHKRHLVAFSCKGRGFCPSCMGRRMNEGAANLVDHVLPEHVPIRQWVLTLPYPLRYPLAFDSRHLRHVLRLFTDTVAAWYSRHHPGSQTGSVTVIQRASSDLRLNPHFHTLFLDGVYLPPAESDAPDAAPPVPIFRPAPKPTQADIEFVVERARERILRYLEKRGVITFATAPGDDEVNAVLGEGFGESDPAHSTLLSTATSGSLPAGPAQKRKPVLMSREADTSPEPRGYLCAQIGAFNLHAARRVAPNDKQGKEMLCRYILRPPLANERLHLLTDGTVTVEFKRPWSDGTRSIGLAPQALISRMAALVPPPKRHVTVYSGVLASHSKWRKLIIPKPEGAVVENGAQENAGDDGIPANPVPGQAGKAEKKPKVGFSKYIPWHELLRRTFGEEVRCPQCGGRLRLVALVKTDETIKTLLTAMHLPTGPPKVVKPMPPETHEEGLEWSEDGAGESTDWPEYPD